MGSTSSRRAAGPLALPDDLTRAIEQAGYYPSLVGDVVQAALGGDEVVSHLVHQETTFDHDAVRRHITVLALTGSRLVIAHADDHEGRERQRMATATRETVPLRQVQGVMHTHVVPDPEQYDGRLEGRAVTLTLGWGAVSRIDLEPAACGDPNCEADHGYTGSSTADDLSLRVSEAGDGPDTVRQTLAFAQCLSEATAATAPATR